MQTKLAHIIFLLIALILILAASWYEPERPFLSDVLKDISTGVASVTLISWLWRAMGGEPLEAEVGRINSGVDSLDREILKLSTELKLLERTSRLAKDAADTGLAGVTARSMISTSDLAQTYNHAKVVDLCGFTLNSLTETDTFLPRVIDRAKRGDVTLRIVLYDPDNDIISRATVKPDRILFEAKETLEHIVQLTKDFPAESKQYLQVRKLTNGPIYASIWRFDHEMSVMPYLYSATSPDTPVYRISGDSQALFKAYEHEFCALFDRAVPV